MKNLVKSAIYTSAGLSLIGLNNVNAAITFNSSNDPNANLRGTENTADNVIENWVAYLVGFLYLVAIIMILWGAVQILTANGEEEKVKKGKTILIQAVAGLIIVFIANSIVQWVLSGLIPTSG